MTIKEGIECIIKSRMAEMWEKDNVRYITGIGYELAKTILYVLELTPEPSADPTHHIECSRISHIIMDIAFEKEISIKEAYALIDVDEYLNMCLIPFANGVPENTIEHMYMQQKGII